MPTFLMRGADSADVEDVFCVVKVSEDYALALFLGLRKQYHDLSDSNLHEVSYWSGVDALCSEDHVLEHVPGFDLNETHALNIWDVGEDFPKEKDPPRGHVFLMYVHEEGVRWSWHPKHGMGHYETVRLKWKVIEEIASGTYKGLLHG